VTVAAGCQPHLHQMSFPQHHSQNTPNPYSTSWFTASSSANSSLFLFQTNTSSLSCQLQHLPVPSLTRLAWHFCDLLSSSPVVRASFCSTGVLRLSDCGSLWAPQRSSSSHQHLSLFSFATTQQIAAAILQTTCSIALKSSSEQSVLLCPSRATEHLP